MEIIKDEIKERIKKYRCKEGCLLDDPWNLSLLMEGLKKMDKMRMGADFCEKERERREWDGCPKGREKEELRRM